MKQLIILYFALMAFFCGRIIGRRIDTEYREPEGKPTMVNISPRRKRFFSFRDSANCEVVRAGVVCQVLGYAFAGMEILPFIIAFFESGGKLSLQIGLGLLILFFVIAVFAVMLPFSLRYHKNIRHTLDCNWITQMQEALTIYPKQRCRVVEIVDPQTCIIRLWWGRRVFKARTAEPVTVGEKMYAVHSNEKGSPFWTVRTH